MPQFSPTRMQPLLPALARALGLSMGLLVACGAPRAQPLLFHVTVSATPLMEELVALWQPTSPDAPRIEINSASSRDLIAQLRNGAPGDLVLLASEATMQELVEAGRVDVGSVTTAFHNQLLLVAQLPNALEALTSLRVGLGEVGVPVGDYARSFLQAAGLLAPVQANAILLPNEAALVMALEQGALDAAFVYESSATRLPAAFSRIELPAAQSPAVDYPIAAMTAAAAGFVQFLSTDAAHERIARHGFRASSPP